MLKVVAESLSHCYGAVNFVLFVRFDGDRPTNEGDVILFAHWLQQGGAQGAVDAAGDAQHQRLQVTLLQIGRHGFTDITHYQGQRRGVANKGKMLF